MSDMSNMFLNRGNAGQTQQPQQPQQPQTPDNGDGFNADVFQRFLNSNKLYKPRWTEDGKTKLPNGLRALCTSCTVVQGDYNTAIEMTFMAKADFPGGKITVDLEPSSESMCTVGDSIDINWVVLVHLTYTGDADKIPVNKDGQAITDTWRIRLDKPVQPINNPDGLLSAWSNCSLNK